MTSALRRSPSVRTGLFVALATGLYGVSFGALAVKAGFTTWQTSALSLLMFTGGSQFAFVGVVGAGGALGDPRRWGLDGAAVASFVALLWPRLRTRQAGAIAVASALATLLAVPLVPPGVPVLVAAAVAGLVGSSGRMDADGGRAGVEARGKPVAHPSSRDAS